MKQAGMTIKEVSSVFGVSEDTILRAFKKLYPGITKKGKVTYISEYKATRIKEQLNKNYSLRTVADVTTNLEMKEKTLEVLSWLSVEVEKERAARLVAENEVKLLSPKAEFYDRVTDSVHTLEMSAVAKILKTGRNRLFKLLREHGILRENNEPYQTYIDNGCFRVIEQEYARPDGTTGVNQKTLVYQKGVDKIRQLLDECKYI